MTDQPITLAQLKVGRCGCVAAVLSPPAMKERFQDLGLIRGTLVRCTAESFYKDMKVYEIRGASIAVRSCDAAQITLQGGVSHAQV